MTTFLVDGELAGSMEYDVKFQEISIINFVIKAIVSFANFDYLSKYFKNFAHCRSGFRRYYAQTIFRTR